MNEMLVKSGNKEGLELKIARLRARLKQYELAAMVGIAPTQLCEIETGRRELSPELRDQLMQALSRVQSE